MNDKRSSTYDMYHNINLLSRLLLEPAFIQSMSNVSSPFQNIPKSFFFEST